MKWKLAASATHLLMKAATQLMGSHVQNAGRSKTGRWLPPQKTVPPS